MGKFTNQSTKEINEEGKLNFREPTENDGAAMYTLVKNSKVLDLNSSYSYLMWGKYFNKTSILAEIGDRVVGFISGFLQPNAPDTLFVWQVVVAESQRGKGLATSLLEKLLYQLDDIHYLEATVTPSNRASNNLFKGLAKKLGTQCEVSECFLEEQFPDPSHETEWTYRIGPLQ